MSDSGGSMSFDTMIGLLESIREDHNGDMNVVINCNWVSHEVTSVAVIYDSNGDGHVEIRGGE